MQFIDHSRVREEAEPGGINLLSGLYITNTSSFGAKRDFYYWSNQKEKPKKHLYVENNAATTTAD
jgi:hypothetical protein